MEFKLLQLNDQEKSLQQTKQPNPPVYKCEISNLLQFWKHINWK